MSVAVRRIGGGGRGDIGASKRRLGGGGESAGGGAAASVPARSASALYGLGAVGGQDWVAPVLGRASGWPGRAGKLARSGVVGLGVLACRARWLSGGN